MTDHDHDPSAAQHAGPPVAGRSLDPRPSYPYGDEDIPTKRTMSWQIVAVVGLVVLVVVLVLALHMGGVIGHGHH